MARGWILAIVGIGALSTATASAQTGARSLAERLGLGGSSAAADERVIHDPFVQPAATTTNGPRAPRDAATNPARRRTGGGGFFSNFRLPNLLQGGGSTAGGQNSPTSDAPLPYDPAELEAAPGRTQPPSATRRPARRTAPSAGMRQPATGGVVRQPATGAALRTRTPAAIGATGSPNRTTNPTTTTPTASARPAAPRVARSSPRTDNRHNELADALTGLRDEPAEPAAEDSAPFDVDGDVAPPAADQGEAAPSYLSDAEDGEASEPAPVEPEGVADERGWSRGPLDVRDALLGDDAGASSPPPVRTTPGRRTAAPAPTQRILSSPPAVRPTTPTPPPAVPRRTPALPPEMEDDASTDFQADVRPQGGAPVEEEEEDALGDLAAEPAPIEYEAEPAPVQTRVAAPVVTPPRVRPSAVTTKTAPTTTRPSVRGIANLRPRDGDVLVTCRAPVIVSSVAGPQRIVVGRPAEYRVVLENKGEASARELVATVEIPGGADVLDAEATNGAVERTPPADVDQSQTISWKLYELPAGASQTLTVKLVPQSGRALQLAVTCDQAPASGEATVDVQEPRLSMEITGPAEVMFGKAQRYALTLSNPGTGDAEDVLIELVPPGGNVQTPVRHKVGALAAGATKTIELELTAREAGELKMQAAAIAAGDLRAEAVKSVLCRKAKLDVDWRGPDKSFAGSVATYYIRVRNQGTAPADDVAVELSLPAGGELVEASAGHAWDKSRHTVTWQPGELAAGEERFMQVQCKLTNAGSNQLQLVARTAAGDLSDVHSMPVAVEALADLKLQVSDPQGVLPVGKTALYEIRVQNRGMTAARGVNVVAMFSDGIDPSHVEGGQHEIRDGRVAFRTIDALPAGAEVVLRIHAKATRPGTHVFRTEVVCDDLDTKLAAEETTRYFVEEERWADASAAYSDGGEETTR